MLDVDLIRVNCVDCEELTSAETAATTDAFEQLIVFCRDIRKCPFLDQIQSYTPEALAEQARRL